MKRNRKNKKKSKTLTINQLTGEKFIGGKAKVKFGRTKVSEPKVFIVTSSQARLLLIEDNEENYPLEEGW